MTIRNDAGRFLYQYKCFVKYCYSMNCKLNMNLGMELKLLMYFRDDRTRGQKLWVFPESIPVVLARAEGPGVVLCLLWVCVRPPPAPGVRGVRPRGVSRLSPGQHPLLVPGHRVRPPVPAPGLHGEQDAGPGGRVPGQHKSLAPAGRSR